MRCLIHANGNGIGCHSVDTNGDYIELYCEMMQDDMASGRRVLQELTEERDRLRVELFRLQARKTDPYILNGYYDRITELSKQISEVANPPKYDEWWAEVQEEVATIRQQQERVKQAIAKGEPLRKAQAVRQLIDHIVVEWATEPTSDRRHKGGVRTFCKGVRVIGTDGHETPIMTNETPSG
jgi:hypothetical protein